MVVWLPGSALTRINKNPGDGERMDKTRTAAVRIMKRVICLGSYQGSDAVAWWLADTLQASPDVSADFEIVRCASPAQLVSLCAGADILAIIDASPDLEPRQRAPPKRDEIGSMSELFQSWRGFADRAGSSAGLG